MSITLSLTTIGDNRRRPAAGARRRLEEPVVHQDVAPDGVDPRGLDLARQVVEPRQRIAGHERGVEVTARIGVVVVLEEQGPVGPGPAPETEVALGDQDEVTPERPLRVHLAAAHHRGLEPVIRPKIDQRRGGRVQLGDRGRAEQLVGVPLVERPPARRIDDQEAPVAVLIPRSLQDARDPLLQALVSSRREVRTRRPRSRC